MDAKINHPIYDLEHLKDHISSIAPNNIRRKKPTFDDPGEGIKSYTFKNYHFSGSFQGYLFYRCKFIDCTFENIWGFFLYFKKCEFTKSEFKNSRFSHGQFSWTELSFYKCSFKNVEIDEGDLDNSIFEDCFLQGLSLIGESLFNVKFLSCHIENSQFQSVVYYADGENLETAAEDILFQDCDIQFCYFATSDFRNSKFFDSTIYLCAFIDCVLANQTIIANEKDLSPNYASLDFQTILKSDLHDPLVLKNYFNIHTLDLKEKIKEISTKISFKKIFISYSFKDKIFASMLNKILNKNGVKTFLWENDAPGGEYLENIMRDNVREHDTILFIASENSLKSKACQFELSEGRKKQEETWKNVFFPIHIDSYLFEVVQNQIRPIEKSEEYWNNIQELRRTNSKDFTAFSVHKMIDPEKFESAVINDILKYIQFNFSKEPIS